MDVLEFWQPTIQWNEFRRGAVSESLWQSFCQTVRLCHAACHWERGHREESMAVPRMSLQPRETRRDFKNRHREWKREVQRRDAHMHRAEYLADSKVAEMSHLLRSADPGSADWKLWRALRCTIGRRPKMRCKAAAFASFDSVQELEDEWEQIALRWLRDAGYIEAQA